MTKKTIKKTTTTVVEEVVENTNKKNDTKIICILDRSGSMARIIDDAIGGFNSFIEQQKELGDDASVTVALFDNYYELLYDNVNIKDVKKITDKEWSPRGSTALYDALGKTINTVVAEEKKLKKKERPSKHLVCIVTDGHENDSKEYSQDVIKKLISKQEKADWRFVYIGADANSVTSATNLGFSKGNTLLYTNTSAGNRTMFNTMSKMSANYRGMAVGSAEYMDSSNSLAFNATDGSGAVGEEEKTNEE